MYKLTCDILAGFTEWNFVTDLEIQSSYENLTDTCKMTLPRKISLEGEPVAGGENSVFKPGELVNVLLGYDGVYRTAFTGFIRRIDNKTPLMLHCEDSMYTLKQKEFTASYREVSLSQLIADMLPGVRAVTADTNLGQWRISKASPAKVLDTLKEKYRLYSWFREGTLYVGTPYITAAENYQQEHRFKIGVNIISDDNLEYRRDDETKLKVKAVSMMPDNSKKEIELGDSSGEQRTLHFYNLDEKALKEAAERELENLKKEGYRGSFLAFGEPFVRHGDAVILTDKRFEERGGKYFVKAVTYTFGTGGFRQKIELDRRLA